MKIYNQLLGAAVMSLGIFSSVFAAGIDHFEVQLAPDTINVWESMDLTIKAVDKNNNVITDYNGEIIMFSETDPEATLPSVLKDNTYEFKNADQGEVTFENSVSFKLKGKQEISVYDLNDDTVLGIAQAEITGQVESANAEISIVSPETGITIGEDSIKVSWSTSKNHALKITLNEKEVFEATSNNNGVFELDITGLQDGENTIKAHVLDADKNIIGETGIVNLKVELNKLQVKNVKITPESPEIEAKYTIEIMSQAGLKEVSGIIDDVLVTFTESTTQAGTYSAELFASKKSGDYLLDVILKNDIGHETKELWVATLSIKDPELNAADPIDALLPKDPNDLSIHNLKVIKLKSKSVLTWDEVEKAEWYNVYTKAKDGTLELVQRVAEAKIEIDITGDTVKHAYFAIKAVGKNDTGVLYEWDLSEATKIQTGPEMYILLLLSLLIGGFFFTLRRKSKLF